MSVRRFPEPESMRRGISGTCKWCGEATVKKPAIYWHRECFDEYALHTRLDAQYQFLVGRDGERCAWPDCGDQPMRWIAQGVMQITWRPYMGDLEWAQEFWRAPEKPYAQWTAEERETGAHQRIERVTSLQVDHRVPLWSVADLPDDERRWYFGPVNLWLLCPTHHKAKTKREAAQRAQSRALAKAQIILPL